MYLQACMHKKYAAGVAILKDMWLKSLSFERQTHLRQPIRLGPGTSYC